MSLKSLTLAGKYNSVEHDLIRDFYAPVLDRSIKYDRATGYFSQAVSEIMNKVFIDFAIRKGKMRLLCSHALKPETIKQIKEGYVQRSKAAVDEIKLELETMMANPTGHAALGVITTLIKTDSLDIKVVIKESGSGMFHDKWGIFEDTEGNQIAFMGSGNETAPAWNSSEEYSNSESFMPMTNWVKPDGTNAKSHCEQIERDFSKWWDSNADERKYDEWLVIPFSEISSDTLERSYNHNDPENAFQEYLDIIRKEYNTEHQVFDKETSKPIPARKHQDEGKIEWIKNNCEGILEHCTGSGKTFTAMRCIEYWCSENPEGTVLILVPSTLLLDQWYEELLSPQKGINPDKYRVSKFGGDNSNHPNIIQARTSKPSPMQNVAISTIQTAYKADFYNNINASKLLVVCDEVHRIGSQSFKAFMENTDPNATLGLSATPERYNDPEGTAAIKSYFGNIISTYLLPAAIRDGHLTPYKYFPRFLNLTPSEQTKWANLTRKILRLAHANKNADQEENFTKLLVRRASIIKGAKNKVPIACDIINAHYKPGDRWLVYCENKKQLDAVEKRIKLSGVNTQHYYSQMPEDKKATLDNFEYTGGILVAINCLDEGIDIPCIDNALILASSQNPRQYIQRRGRVLRSHTDKITNKRKSHANIYDLLVEPVANSNANTDETSIIIAELKRAYEFNHTSEQPERRDNEIAINRKCNEFGIDIDNLTMTQVVEENHDDEEEDHGK